MTVVRQDPGTDTDWASIRARLTRAAEATRTAARPSRKQSGQIFADRTRALAAPLEEHQSPGPSLHLVTFTLERERFALETRFVRAVGGKPDITAIPGGAHFLLGVTTFRGVIVVIFDLRSLLDGSAGSSTERSRVLFLGTDLIEFGILADEVHETRIVSVDAVGARPWRADDQIPNETSGLTADGLNVLDGAALLNDERFFIDHTHAVQAALKEIS